MIAGNQYKSLKEIPYTQTYNHTNRRDDAMSELSEILTKLDEMSKAIVHKDVHTADVESLHDRINYLATTTHDGFDKVNEKLTELTNLVEALQ